MSDPRPNADCGAGCHPCPTPARTRRDREGALWACICGRVHVLRNDHNYAGDAWQWKPTILAVTA